MEQEEERAWPFDMENGAFDLRYLRPTDLPFNKGVCLPTALKNGKEIDMQHLKGKLMRVTEEYIEAQGKKVAKGNLTHEEQRGLRSLRSKENAVVFQTDKSGRFAVDTVDNYRVACQHVENDHTVTEELHERVPAEADAHSVLWVRPLNAGEVNGGQARIKSNMLVNDCTLASLYTLRKDHKTTFDQNVGQPVRPVCGAMSAYYRNLSHFMSVILTEVWKAEESVCLNTEEMLAGFKEVNDSRIMEEIIIGSADVKALYPSLDISFTVEKVCEVFYTSGIRIDGLNKEELGLYLALNRSEAVLRGAGLLQFCPWRKTNRGRPPTITGCALDEDKTKRFKPWLPPSGKPDDDAVRRMFTEAMKVVISFIMENHLYTFDGQIKLQSEGGPIGLQLTGVLAQLFMVLWDRQFKIKMDENGLRLRMYKRYVDDINVIVNAPRAGLKFVVSADRVIQDENIVEQELAVKADKRCMNLVQKIGNSIHPSISLEVDYPSQHVDGKLPTLDLKVWVELRRIQSLGEEGNEVNVVLHEFYFKDVASKCVINARSALPWSCKRTILTQEVLRILLNCSRELPWETTVSQVNHMMLRLQYSCHDQKLRTEVVRSALKAYNRMNELDASAEQPLYRPREWKRLERAQERRGKRESWYRKEIFDTVIFLPATPGSQLKTRYTEEIKGAGFKIKVVEQSGCDPQADVAKVRPVQGKRMPQHQLSGLQHRWKRALPKHRCYL